jgi:hypothetical protein
MQDARLIEQRRLTIGTFIAVLTLRRHYRQYVGGTQAPLKLQRFPDLFLYENRYKLLIIFIHRCARAGHGG